MKPSARPPRPKRTDDIKAHLVAEHRHDPYHPRGKLSEPSQCPTCGAVFAGGRWQWRDVAPAEAVLHVCPACRRIADRYPAGEIILSGSFVLRHHDEIAALLRNVEAADKRQHPLHRIMAVVDEDAGMRVTTTDIHLPRRIGHALVNAYKGTLTTYYDEAGHFVRITWSRDG